MDPGYLATTGDGCVDRVVRGWLEQGNVHSCLRGTGVDIEEFALHARALVPGLGAEQAAPNHCLNASLSAYLSVYGALTLRMSLTAASDAAEPRCHAFGGSVPSARALSLSLSLSHTHTHTYTDIHPAA
eukprot:3118066-Rhodomonas_salina.1